MSESKESFGETEVIIYKAILLGDTSVGKTSILKSYIDENIEINEENINQTIGCDIKTKHLKIDDERIKLFIYDTAGQDKFNNLNESILVNMNGVIFVYDIGNKDSFDKIKDFYFKLIKKK